MQELCTHTHSSATGTRTRRANLDGPRMSMTTTSARRVCASQTIVPGDGPRRTHLHQGCACGRASAHTACRHTPRRRSCPATVHGAVTCTKAARAAGQPHTPRVATRNYAQEDWARAQRPERAHACCRPRRRPPAALLPCIHIESNPKGGGRAGDIPTKAAQINKTKNKKEI